MNLYLFLQIILGLGVIAFIFWIISIGFEKEDDNISIAEDDREHFDEDDTTTQKHRIVCGKPQRPNKPK